MSKYRISKIQNNAFDPVETMPFENEKEAEHYAKSVSVGDHDHFYVLEERDEEFDDYDDIKYFVNGEVNEQL
jgi:hypothetical protein